MLKKPVNILFLNSLLFIGLIYNVTPIYSVPIEVIPSQGIIYPIHVACECDYNIYVDGKLVKSVGIVKNWDGSDGGVNVTNIFNPVIYETSPKIIAFSSNNNEYPDFISGFAMDMNNGKDYTKHEEWKCKYFDLAKNEVVPSNWMANDYNDIEWPISVSYGKNYQNNSFQIFDHERDGIHLEAEWLWTSVNSNPNIYCRKKRLDNELYYVEAAPPVQTSAAPPTTSVAPHIVQTSASAPLHEKVYVSQTIHVPHTQPILHVSNTIHRPASTSAPTPTSTATSTATSTSTSGFAPTPIPTSVSVTAPSKNNYNIIIHQHINFVIQNFKYTQKHSYTHIENLLRHLKSITQNHHLYKNLLYTRRHLYNHYNTMFKELYRLLKEFDTNNHLPHGNTIDPFYPNDDNDNDNDNDNDDNSGYDNDDNNTYDNDNESQKRPPFIKSMKILDRHIQQIEKGIHFIKGKYKYILLNILHNLKLQYRHDTIRLLHYWINRFI
jgi:hypothetical protein